MAFAGHAKWFQPNKEGRALFRNIIWDVDGTLFDTYPAIVGAFKTALQALGKDADQAWIMELAKQSLSQCEEVLIEKYQLDRAEFERILENNFDRIPIDESPPFPGAPELCQYICSIGGKNVIVTHRGRAGTVELLAGHKLAAYFSGWITRDDGYSRKPDPAAFEAALAGYDLQRDETLTVGDRQIDILAGQAAGLFSCFYGDEVDSVKADLVVSSFDELYEFLVKPAG
jgi:HAD superfamily hydrolase (TIGR01509 family)